MSAIITLDDTLDSRRAVWHLLHRMHPRRRFAYLNRCCEACKDGLGNGLFPLPSMRREVREAERCERADARLTNGVYADLVQLAAGQGLNLLAVALELEQLAKGHAAAPRSAALRRA